MTHATALIFMLRFIVIFLIGYGVLLLSPFGLADRIRDVQQDVINAISSGYYPNGPRVEETEPAAVVMIDEASLERFHEEQQAALEAGGNGFPTQPPAGRWPVPYDVHDWILADIIRMRPAAIMVDIVFDDVREWDKGYIDWGERIRKAQADIETATGRQVPIYFATESGTIPQGSPIHLLAAPDGAPAASYIHAARAAWVPNDSWYPMYPGDAGHGALPSPAYQIFRDLCLRNDAARKRQDGLTKACGVYAGDRAYRAGDDFSKQMMIRWPAGRAPLQNQITDIPNCTSHPETGVDRFTHMVTTMGTVFLRGVQGGEPEALQPCPPIVRVGAEWFLPSRKLDQGRAFPAIRDRVVFYGASIKGIPDIVRSPVQGYVSGVEYHALAYHNLAYFGAEYYQRAPVFARMIEAFLWMIVSAAAAARLGALDSFVTTGDFHAVYARSRRRFALIVLSVTALSFILAVFMFAVESIAPIDFITILSMSGLLHLVEGLLPGEGCAAMLMRFLERWGGFPISRGPAAPPPTNDRTGTQNTEKDSGA